jgi:uroporphyrin-III C-methyltransferase/precorrin-2 dehydrogenase/sirohydrochlorin ferrochelatase
MRRTPAEIQATRIGPLARLPAFFALEGKRALVAGGSEAAAWKAELLAAAGAKVEVFAPGPGEDMIALCGPPDSQVALHDHAWSAADFTGSAIAVADCADDREAENFAAAARAAGVPVNIIDRPAFSDFTFGAIVNRSPLVIGISTDGAAPVFGQAIRAKIEALIPKGFARWADAARLWRPRVQALALPFRGRRSFWEKFTARAIAAPERTPTEADLDALLAPAAAQHAGSVVLVGAGPGDPELLTLRAVRALQSADVILFDDLVASDILDFARREAKKMLVGKTGHKASCRQDDINALMISLARAGRRVVRLKGGDPMIFGRADEEIAACRAAGIAVEVVPGITTAQGAASRLLVSLTRRGEARRVQYITGHGRDGKLPADIDWLSLADAAATTVVYMPTKTLPDLVTAAVQAGLDPATPAVAVERATRGDERVIAATIAELPTRLAAAGPSGPVVVMIGRVFANYREAANEAAPSGRQARA